jgi:hypothetical protein
MFVFGQQAFIATLAGSVSPNKRKILLKTIEQLGLQEKLPINLHLIIWHLFTAV